MNVLVTGSTSKAGREIVRELTKAGAVVRGTTHLRRDRARDAAPGTVAVDFEDPRTLERAFSSIEKAVLIIPESRVMGTLAADLTAVAERAGVAQLVLVSFLHADLLSGGAVLRWHREAEEAVGRSDVPSTVVRPNYYMQNFLSAYLPAASLGSGNVSYIDAADVAAVIAHIVLDGGHEGTTYSLTGPRALSREEVSALLRGETAPLRGSEAEREAEACERRRRSGMTAELQALCEFWASVDADQFAAVTPDFERLMGRPPKTFEHFVREHRGDLQAWRTARPPAPVRRAG